MQVLHVCHHAAFNASLVKEWECHSSHFSMTWRAAMTSRGKMDRGPEDLDPGLEALPGELHPLARKDNPPSSSGDRAGPMRGVLGR